MRQSTLTFLEKHNNVVVEAEINYDGYMKEFSWSLWLKEGESGRRFMTCGYFVTYEEAEQDIKQFVRMYI